ncbi:MAG TPA: acyl-CoA dehydratase activase [bacterium]|nr:acyl-CoA dehydratase activase [bacterium]
MICAGMDAGSRTVKLILWDSERQRVIGRGRVEQGTDQNRRAHDLFREVLANSGLSASDVRRTIATGYGRHLIDFADTTVTEITCHARGVRFLIPDVRTVIEIGGQDSKVIKMTPEGTVRDFAMNDRCAAGTGRFLEMTAQRLEMTLDDLACLSTKSVNPAVISSMCVVFAETEIVGLLAQGTACEDIVAGVQRSIAERLLSMLGNKVDDPVVFTGGVATIPSMVRALQDVLERSVTTAPEPFYTGALGAALLASVDKTQ